MKIAAKFYFNNNCFDCLIHVKNNRIVKVTSIDKVSFFNELEELQPSIFGAKKFLLIKKEKEVLPFQIYYMSKKGWPCYLFLESDSLLYYYYLKIYLKINFESLIVSFIIYSFMAIIGVFLNVINGEFDFGFLDYIVFSWVVMAMFFIWKLHGFKNEYEEEIKCLKSKEQ